MPDQASRRWVAVVMAGGSGERFWPISRHCHPKQLLCLTQEGETMLGEAVRRIAPLIPPRDVYVVTGRHLVAAIREAQVGVPDANVIAEPCKRNTAGCLAYAAAHVLATHGGDGHDLTMAVLTADHVIGDEAGFREAVRTAMEAAEGKHALATLGVVPTRPDTGYGYIQINADHRPLTGYEQGTPVYAVERYHEKPDRDRAEALVASGCNFWNAGMFFWRVSDFLAELEKAAPPIAQAVTAMAAAMADGDEAEVERVFEALDSVSIDYALMEKAEDVLVARADFPWDDVGTWAALDRTREHDDAGNVLTGDPVVCDCANSIVYNDAGDDMAVAVVGMDNAVVIVARDAVLVMPKDRAQDVRQAVAELKKRRARQL